MASAKPWVVALVGALVLIALIFGTRAFFMSQNRAAIASSRTESLDRECVSRGHQPYAWRYTGGKPGERDALAGHDGCAPMDGFGSETALYCCSPK